MQRQLIRDVAHNQPIMALAHLPSQANRPNHAGGDPKWAMIGHKAGRLCFFAARRWRHSADGEAPVLGRCGP